MLKWFYIYIYIHTHTYTLMMGKMMEWSGKLEAAGYVEIDMVIQDGWILCIWKVDVLITGCVIFGRLFFMRKLCWNFVKIISNIKGLHEINQMEKVID